MLKNFTNIFAKTFLCILIFITIIITFIIGKFVYNLFSTGLCTEYKNIEHYQNSLQNVREKDGITHFPKEIPKKAKNISFYSFSGAFYHQRIFLNFDIDKEYIDKELKRLDLLKGIAPQDTNDPIAISRLNQAKNDIGINVNEYIYYAINNKQNIISIKNKEFPYLCGIGINKNNSSIFYYFNNPEG